MNFLKQNWFKISILIILLLVICLTVYFYQEFRISQINKESVALQEKCVNDGRSYYLQFYADTGTGSDGTWWWGTPEYHFNSRLHTCLVYWEKISESILDNGSKLTYTDSGVVDIYTDKTILSSTNDLHNHNKYIQQKNILMNE